MTEENENFFCHSDCRKTKIIRHFPKVGDLVRVHMDLNKKLIAVRSMETNSKYYGKTLIKTQRPIYVQNVKFRVQESAHERVVKTGVRDVCAYIYGKWADQKAWAYKHWHDNQKNEVHNVRYNPFRSKYFTADGKFVKKASVVKVEISHYINETEESFYDYSILAKDVEYHDVNNKS